tara:strand:- start:83 stop:418 length:336 start_codon:yes stop_codon:yes gene_type:complete
VTYKLYKILAPLILSLLLTGCGGGIAAIIGLGPTATTVVKGISGVKLGVDAGLAIAGEKSTNEMMLSAVTEKDCEFIRVLSDKDICIEHVKKKQQKLEWDYGTTPWRTQPK